MDWAEGKALRLLTDFAGPLLARVCDALPTGFEPVARALNDANGRQPASCRTLEASWQRVADARQQSA